MQWEYKIEEIDDGFFTTAQNKLNNLGKQGWELVGFREITTQNGWSEKMGFEYIFKRPIE
ncbi:DUF4177 domain-containing protein [Brevibacillus parabrevis]|uniref:DUF4177 domain-containing protein n=1 Tax=Brevibacillus parabrevis TaxID=54914 RepID=UPI002E22793D|nr:DUF4177 domain-containing protein [Brevibacillus parabrevis]